MRSLLGRTAAISVAALTVFVGVTSAGASADSTADPECTPVESSTSTAPTTDVAETSVPETTAAEPLESSTTSTTAVDCAEPTTTTESTAPSTTLPAATTTTSTSTTTTSTSTTTTEAPGLGETEPAPTTQPPALVADMPSPAGASPRRGTDQQVAETLPPPSTTTTTTTTLPPEWSLPANSGSGRRIVYRKSWPMRVWTVESSGAVSKTHLVSGRATWNQPLPGTYSVFSRSYATCNINNPHICWNYMVRFTKGPGGDNIGFHEIPTNYETGYKLQSESQLGLALSAGCVRQRESDALYIWNWAPVGTKVVVLP